MFWICFKVNASLLKWFPVPVDIKYLEIAEFEIFLLHFIFYTLILIYTCKYLEVGN